MDQSLRGSTKPSSLALRQPKKTMRVLACVLCQQRKKKCDRSSPCSNCIKVSVMMESRDIKYMQTDAYVRAAVESRLHPQYARSSTQAAASKPRAT